MNARKFGLNRTDRSRQRGTGELLRRQFTFFKWDLRVEIPTRSVTSFRESERERRKRPRLTLARRGTPGSSYYPEVLALELGFPFGLSSLGFPCSPEL